MLHPLLYAVLLLGVFIPATSFSETPTWDGNRLSFVSPKGAVDALHLEVDEGGDLVAPVQWNGVWYYAVRNDLLKLDIEKAQVVQRFVYPAAIVSLKVEDENLTVGLKGERAEFAVRHRTEGPSFRGPWSNGMIGLMRPLSAIPQDLVHEEPKSAELPKFKKELDDIIAFDQTNPLAFAYRGFVEKEEGREPTQFFDKADYVGERSPWHDNIMLCGFYERVDSPVRANDACERAGRKMDSRGIDRNQIHSLVMFVIVTGDLRKAMETARVRRDFKRVDRIANHMYSLFPNVEAAPVAWRQLADWLESHNQKAAANRWRDRSAELENSKVTKAFWGQTRPIDLSLLWLAALPFFVVIAAFAAGVRRSRKPLNGNGWKQYIVFPSIVELFVVLALVIFGVGTSLRASQGVTRIGSFASMPLGALHSGFSSPDVVEWLDMSLPPSEAQKQLITFARNERVRLEEGGAHGEHIDALPLLAEAIDALAKVKSKDRMLSFSLAYGPDEFPNALPLVLPLLLVGFLFFIVGVFVGRASKNQRLFLSLVPVGHFGFLTGVSTMAFLCAIIFLLTPVGSILQEIALPSFGKFFGDNSEVEFVAHPVDQWWPWVALIVVVLLHFTSMFWAYRSSGQNDASVTQSGT